MGFVVIPRVREETVVAFNGVLIIRRDLLRLPQIGHAAVCLDIIPIPFHDQQRHFWVGQDIFSVLCDTADLNDRPALPVKTIRSHRAERITLCLKRMGGQDSLIFTHHQTARSLPGLFFVNHDDMPCF